MHCHGCSNKRKKERELHINIVGAVIGRRELQSTIETATIHRELPVVYLPSLAFL